MGSANRTSCTSCTEACRRGLQGRVCGISLWPSNSPKVQWRHLVSFYVFINCNALPNLKQKSNKTLLKKKKLFHKYSFIFRFDSAIPTSPLIFSDQFLQISTRLSSPLLYGIGERYGPLLVNTTSSFHRFSLWNRDQWPSVSVKK